MYSVSYIDLQSQYNQANENFNTFLDYRTVCRLYRNSSKYSYFHLTLYAASNDGWCSIKSPEINVFVLCQLCYRLKTCIIKLNYAHFRRCLTVCVALNAEVINYDEKESEEERQRRLQPGHNAGRW